jgi:hypothetical protein
MDLSLKATLKTPPRFCAVLALAICMAVAPGGPPARAQDVPHGVAAGLLDVSQIFGIDDNTNAEVTLARSINNFQIGTFNRADYNLLIGNGALAASDESLGVLMTSVAENGRNNFGTNGYPTSSFATNGNGTYRIVAFLGTDGGAGNAIEYNANVAGAWFPYDRYLGGFARNSAGANGGTNDTFTGSPGLVLGEHFRGVAAGQFVVDLESFDIDSRTDGVLLVTHAKDENNYALSQVNTNDGTWNVFVRDNAQPTYANYEQDPVAFVFIPKADTSLISGRFNADASIGMFSGASPQFTVTNIGTGRWDLRVIGHSPTNGVLILSPEGGGDFNGDNIVSYELNATQDGWEIQSRDTPNNGLQTPTGDPVVSFVYIPKPFPGVSVSPVSGLETTGSGGSAAFEVTLQTPPASDVHIDVTSSDSAKGTVTPGILTFGPSDWYLPQTVTVTGQEGAQDGGYSIVLSPVTSADPVYQGLDPEDVTVTSMAARAFAVWPTNDARPGTTAPSLRVVVTNTTPGSLTVTFYGRPTTTTIPGPDFSIAVMPDTQFYTAETHGGTKAMMIAQTEWIINNRISGNVVYATQLGDISNNGDTPSYISQWYNATNAMYRLESPVRTQLANGIAYGVAVGNHEQSPISTASGTTTNYNKYFGVPHFTGRSYYAGHYGTNNNNHFDFFSASGLDFVVLYFEYNPSPPAALLAWGNEVLRTNAHRRAIIVTHSFGNTANPLSFSAQGAAIYQAFKTNKNIIMMLGGHVTGQGSRQDTYNGHTIRTFVQDYQGWTNGGNGFMRTFTFSPSNNVVVVQTFSPWTGEYLTDQYSEFFFPYDLQAPGIGTAGSFVALATNLAVAPGSLSTCVWPGLLADKAYEWYVAVTDQSGITVTSPVWRFATAFSNARPTTPNVALTVLGDSPAILTLPASDLDGDLLTFQTNTSPSHGLLRNLDPSSGTVTYWPAYGYHGSDRFTFSAHDGQLGSSVASVNLNVISPPDANSNGLSDAWEAAYGISDPGGDADGDGQSNLQECLANTNPTNAASGFEILSRVRQTNGHFVLTWSSVGGTCYRVQFRNRTATSGVAGAFTDIVRPLTNEMDPSPYGATSTRTFTDDFTLTGGAPTNYSRYYRVRVVR